jgi:hypothetical protein
VRDAVGHQWITCIPMPPPRRTPSSGSSPPAIARGATARSAASPRVGSSLATRRPPHNGDAKEPTPKHDADLKDQVSFRRVSYISLFICILQLLVQLQNKDQSIAALATENDSLTSALHATETRLNELYAEQLRSEVELAQRIDIIDKLRAQVRELEREKRDLQRRYNEQAC